MHSSCVLSQTKHYMLPALALATAFRAALVVLFLSFSSPKFLRSPLLTSSAFEYQRTTPHGFSTNTLPLRQPLHRHVVSISRITSIIASLHVASLFYPSHRTSPRRVLPSMKSSPPMATNTFLFINRICPHRRSRNAPYSFPDLYTATAR